MKESKIAILRDGDIKTAINKMSIPAIVGLLIMALYNIADTMFVSWISSDATSATQIIFPLMLFASAIGLTFGVGAGSYISRLLGKNDIKEANKVSSTSFFSALAIGIIFTVINLLFAEEIFRVFGANDDIIDLTLAYGNTIIIGYSFSILNMVFNNQLRAEGSAKYSMIGMIIGSVLNIVLDPILIFGLDMGIQGAAIATTFSQLVTTIILVSIYLKGKTVIKINLSHFKPSKSIYKEIFVVGIPTLFKQLLVSVSIILLNIAAVSVGGNDLLAAVGILFKVTILPIYIIFGLGQGLQPVAGYNYGANKQDRVMEALRYTIKLCNIVGIVTFIAFFFFGESIFSIFKQGTYISQLGAKGLKYYSIGILSLGITNTITMFYATIGKGTESLILSTTRQGVFFIPIVLILPDLIGIDGVLLAQPIADVLTFILAVAMITPFVRKYRSNKLVLQKA